ncbi:hypothetical protein JB92DRAFT_3110106 [Gautieria morchelliformis]|nr:hypothetical protein JB92DRAFT_3110106 [Gautieria morchelliformis]
MRLQLFVSSGSPGTHNVSVSLPHTPPLPPKKYSPHASLSLPTHARPNVPAQSTAQTPPQSSSPPHLLRTPPLAPQSFPLLADRPLPTCIAVLPSATQQRRTLPIAPSAPCDVPDPSGLSGNVPRNPSIRRAHAGNTHMHPGTQKHQASPRAEAQHARASPQEKRADQSSTPGCSTLRQPAVESSATDAAYPSATQLRTAQPRTQPTPPPPSSGQRSRGRDLPHSAAADATYPLPPSSDSAATDTAYPSATQQWKAQLLTQPIKPSSPCRQPELHYANAPK